MQRHLARHGDAFKQSPSGRSKRACIACHASKTKCDGNESCSKCVKKGIDCIYEQQETIHQEEPLTENLSQLQQEPSSQVPASEVAPSMLPPNLEPEEPNGTVSTYSIDISMSGVGSSNPISVASETTAETIAPENRMNWVLYSRIEKDLGFPDVPSAQVGDVPMPLPLDSFRKKCHDLYFLHFHHRWTIFNRPTYDPCDLNILSASVLLIGAWLEGSLEAKEYAIKSHIGLMDDILMKLVRWLHRNWLSYLIDYEEPYHVERCLSTVATHQSLPGSFTEHNLWDVLWGKESSCIWRQTTNICTRRIPFCLEQ